MITVKQWEKNKIDLSDETFEKVCEWWVDAISGPYEKTIAYRGEKSGKLLDPDFSHVLEDEWQIL